MLVAEPRFGSGDAHWEWFVSGAVLLIFLVVAAISAASIGILLWLAPSLNAVEDDQFEHRNKIPSARSSSLRSRLARWFLGGRVRQLDYRRDKRGRFRKIRRG